MAEISDLNDAIADAASQPTSVSGEAGSVSMRSVDDLMKIRNDAITNNASAAGNHLARTLRRTKAVPPGAQ
jgi:hypothetical protein